MTITHPPMDLRKGDALYESLHFFWTPPVTDAPIFFEYRLNGGVPVRVGGATSVRINELTPNASYTFEVRAVYPEYITNQMLPVIGADEYSEWIGPVSSKTLSRPRVEWNKPEHRFFELGLDRGVLFPRPKKSRSTSKVRLGLGRKSFGLMANPGKSFDKTRPVHVRSLRDDAHMTGYISSLTPSVMVLEVEDFSGTGSREAWEIVQNVLPVPWNGLATVEEAGAEGAASFYMDGRPFLNLPKPKEYQATISAYTYPQQFSEIMGMVEATDGMYLDSQQGDVFDFSYRTIVGNGIDGRDHATKIHLVYNATVTPGSISYETLGADLNPAMFSWEIQAVPLTVPGFRPTAHIVIDTRNMDELRLKQLETMIYGDGVTEPSLPSPEVIFEHLTYGDGIIITDNGDGTWTAEGSYLNIIMVSDGVFRIQNAEAIDHGDGTFTISSTSDV